ncbi:MAG: 6-phospho-3-hexuloisomerase [Candidatus Micrarchaeota archaeon]
MSIGVRMEKLAHKIQEQCAHINEKSTEKFLRALLGARRIFIHGVGRSGMVARAFAMRLMHLGFDVYVVGETITPAIRKGDLFIAVSGSGKTSSVNVVARVAEQKKAFVVAVTSNQNSELARCADLAVQIKGRAPRSLSPDYDARQLVGEHEPLTPLGTLFELTTMVFFDAVIDELMLRRNKGENEMREKHTDLE